MQVFNDSPAARAGLQPEDLIVAVNGRSLAGLPEDEATSLVKGPPDTNVTLRIEAPPPAHASHAAGASSTGASSRTGARAESAGRTRAGTPASAP